MLVFIKLCFSDECAVRLCQSLKREFTQLSIFLSILAPPMLVSFAVVHK